MKKVLVGLLHLALLAAFVGYGAYQLRTDPWGPVTGKRLTGAAAAYPASWGFSKQHPLAAVETRLGNPHSVTVITFMLDGALHIPARDGARKEWTANALADSRVRLKMGDAVYPARLARVPNPDEARVRAAINAKYPHIQLPPVSASVQMQDAMGGAAPAEDASGRARDFWLFRVLPR